MKIGCVKEIKNNEFRVGLTPDNVRAYVSNGHHVYIENPVFQTENMLKQALL